MKKIYMLLLSCMMATQWSLAQQQLITGKVTDASGNPLPGATVQVEGTATAAQTREDGTFSLQASNGAVLVVSSVGYQPQRIPIGQQTNYKITLAETLTGLDEVVVTALGLSREQRSLGYSTQQVDGENLNTVNTGNVTSALSGKVAGVQIRTNSGLGGSASIVIRGNKSLTGNNQALWVIDGVPIDNSNSFSSNNGYDFGNLAADINPDDIESVNVLKGAAATALYGSRAANGAIIVTTKKGAKKVGVGITVNSSTTFGVINKNTFAEYQQEYGAAYGPLSGGLQSDVYFNERDVNGDGIPDLVPAYDQYAGFGAAYDPNLMVYQWDSYYPESPYYMQPSPWVPSEHGPLEIFQNPLTLNNSISFAGNNDNATYRLSYTNFRDKGIVPNGSLSRNTFSLNSSFKLTPKLTASAMANYTTSVTNGRSQRGQGSSFSNFIINMRQYWQPNIDFRKVREVYELTGKNLSQFPGGTIDNPFYIIDQNQQSDDRNRFVGNAALSYQLTDWLEIFGRIAVDSYAYKIEDRQNDLIRVPARYSVRNVSFSEVNYDLMLNYNKDLTEKFNISGVFGTNIRRNKNQSIYNATSGGLIVPGLYAINNSLGNPVPASESLTEIGINGYFGSVSLGYDKTFFLDVTGRIDESSTLPKGSNVYFYPSIAGSFVFSELVSSDVLSFGKLRLNYAEVGNDARPQSLVDVLNKPTPFGAVQLYSINNTKNNPNLKLERTQSFEAGIETAFYGNRISLNVSAYQTNTKDQIMPVTITPATGYSSKFVNAGDVRNRGLEISLGGKPLANQDLTWDINVNWAMNRSKVMSLYEGVTNLRLAGYSTDMSLNAEVGQPFGMWWGSDFVYLNGERVVDQTTGKYLKTSTANSVLGNMNPDWNGGVMNTFSYKAISLKFLVDMQKGGDIFSEDMAIGSRNGLYTNTTGLNELGNPVRDPISAGGGLLLPGVAPDGSPNTVRTEMRDRNHALGMPTAPSAMFMYDASYIKLREVSLSYTLPAKFVQRYGLFGAQLSFIGSNLWIIHKNLPYADPEAGLASGTLQNFQTGVFPTTRNFGFNLKLNF
ncbi:TonB-linked outer membrane protein, SusC/RagA family [Parapedobacter luteus]|uniref:TonB-linked outer membrane protein, SusC/RagA family n=1 Tax=Parapedobacter luteus TaxID=623280 RepID=A0A1T4ZVL0_9SPHI|nr:SusC/RagA family TonB-linked outer membrane protein [Parapedobacter luteus]SKB26770.1 TonB-linked outer membrane protein, SusC/RagA family [Parapedobacter luteus]